MESSELFIVDNSDSDWKVQRYLHDWCELSKAIDVATGYFEVGGLLALEGAWQTVPKIRVLMGDEVSKRTKRAFVEGLEIIRQRLDDSIEGEKKDNEFLEGVPAIVDAIASGQIEFRVYRKDKFHAKAYITHAEKEVIGSAALVGSSNLTYPGICDNVELNVRIAGPEVRLLQEWFESHWEDAEPVDPDILQVIQRHTRDYLPFEIYAKALQEYFRGHRATPGEWEANESRMFPVLDQYQRDAYRNLIDIADQHRGAFLCDGVGLGKTFVGLMLIERLIVHDRKQIVLFAPKAAREDVWETVLEQFLPEVNSAFVNLVVYNHTDLQRKDPRWLRNMELTLRDADAVIIDEAHHFRNPGVAGGGERDPSRYRKLFSWIHAEGSKTKRLFLLTATPVNNGVHDLRHQIELFTGGDERHFASTCGINSTRRWFVDLERNIMRSVHGGSERQTEISMNEAEEVLHGDRLFRELVVQRSRSYVRESQKLEGGSEALFPDREPPLVAAYDLKKTYGALLESVEKAFNKDNPLFVLGIYYPLGYFKGDRESADFAFDENRQKQVVGLIRTLFLKRFESSATAFEASCWRLLRKLLTWVTAHAERDLRRLERWKLKHSDVIGYVAEHQAELWPDEAEEDEIDVVIDEAAVAEVETLDPGEYRIDDIIDDTFDDLDQLVEFLKHTRKVDAKNDDKLKTLIRLLKTDKVLKSNKVILFSEFADTARYVERELKLAGIEGVHRIDGGTKQGDRSRVIRRFSPYYNGTNSPELEEKGEKEIRVLVTTDVLAEGLNLQDATRLINYDLHWNPVRLMQRIGRIDRRMNPAIEEKMITDHPDVAKLRGLVAFWNFLPPDELNRLLTLYNRVTHKTLVISKTLGIESGQLLTAEDEYEAIKEFNAHYEGEQTAMESLQLEYERLLKEQPDLEARLAGFPRGIFSGREHPKTDSRAVFLCYRLPKPETAAPEKGETVEWTEEAGETLWFCYDLESEEILVDAVAIADLVRSEPETPRRTDIERKTLSEIRKTVEKKIRNERLKPMNAPIGVEPILKCWMELN